MLLGHTPFAGDITDALRGSGDQTVTVRAEDAPFDLAKPRGRQDWQLEPHALWYPRTTGIWQPVWLERVPRSYIETVRWTPHVEGFEIGFEARVAGDARDDFDVEVELRQGGRVLAADRYRIIDRGAVRRIALSDPGIDDFRNELLWSPERPTLIDATVRLHRGAEVLDEARADGVMAAPVGPDERIGEVVRMDRVGIGALAHDRACTARAMPRACGPGRPR